MALAPISSPGSFFDDSSYFLLSAESHVAQNASSLSSDGLLESILASEELDMAYDFQEYQHQERQMQILQQQDQAVFWTLNTPTMHPKLVSTLKSIISPPSEQMLSKISSPEQSFFQSQALCENAHSNFRTHNGSKENETEAAVVSVDLIQNRRPFKCCHAGCNKTFKNPQTMKMHLKTHYSSERQGLHSLSSPPSAFKAGQNKKIPSRCPICRRTFVGLYELRRHFGRKHSEGEKRHACRKCGKKFYIEVDLRDHEKLCGEPIICKCGMKFAFRCNLVAHKKSRPECQDIIEEENSTSSTNMSSKSRANRRNNVSLAPIEGLLKSVQHGSFLQSSSSERLNFCATSQPIKVSSFCSSFTAFPGFYGSS